MKHVPFVHLYLFLQSLIIMNNMDVLDMNTNEHFESYFITISKERNRKLLFYTDTHTLFILFIILLYSSATTRASRNCNHKGCDVTQQ